MIATARGRSHSLARNHGRRRPRHHLGDHRGSLQLRATPLLALPFDSLRAGRPARPRGIGGYAAGRVCRRYANANGGLSNTYASTITTIATRLKTRVRLFWIKPTAA